MDNETRQFDRPGSPNQPERHARPRPKQYIPDRVPEPAPQQQYAQPGYSQPQYTEPVYEEPYYPPQQYQQYAAPAQEPEKGDNVPAIVLGVLFAVAAVAATVLFFLWRGAAAEADKPPVTVTQTQTVTTTETTTKRPSLFGRDESTKPTRPQEPTPAEPTAPTEPEPAPPRVEIPPELRGLFDELRDGAESVVQGQ